MADPRNLIKEVAHEVLAGSRYRQFKYLVQDGRIRHNMLGGEVDPKPEKGVILAHREGWYIQKTSVNSFSAHAESLMPFPLNVGDKVEIKHAGFSGLNQQEGESGMGFSSITLSRKHLQSPADHPIMKDMVQQLSDMTLPDGRRGLHLLSDLQFKNFRGEAPTEAEFNPFVEFEVTGAKFTGTVRLEYCYGADTYKLHFKGATETVTLDDIHFDEMLPRIEEHCDSSQARFAKVTVLSRAKVAKASFPAPSM
jgi:hypothetical protein